MPTWGGKTHATISQHINYLQEKGKNTSEYFKFGTTRNPWDRIVSLYYHFKGMENKSTNSVFCKNNTFEEYVKSAHYDGDSFERLMYRNGVLSMDYFIKFESVLEDVQYVFQKIGVEKQLPHINANAIKPKKCYREMYTQETQEMVFDKFRKEIEFFNYNFQEKI